MPWWAKGWSSRFDRDLCEFESRPRFWCIFTQMKVETLGWLVDIQPIYQALIELKSGSDDLSVETKKFLRFKLEAEIQHLSGATVYLRKQLQELDSTSRNRKSGRRK